MLLVPALLAAAGCGAVQGLPQGSAQDEQGGQLTVKRGGVLKFATPGQAKNMHPFRHSGSARTSAFDPVYEPLLTIKYLPNDNYASDDMTRWDFRTEDVTTGWLAERWEQPSPTTYVFHLRKGVRWTDGEELTAEDVGFTWDLLKNNKFPRDSTKVALLDSYDVLDNYTIRANLSRPDPLFLKNWRQESYILPQHVAERGDTFEKVAIGTGPFVIKEFSDIAGVTHARNESYWDQPRPQPDGLRVFYGLDRSAMISAFVTSQLDLVKPDDFGGQLILEQNAPNALHDIYLADHGRGFIFNVSRKPFDDVRVRRAINMVVDRKALIDRVNMGKLGMPNPPGTASFSKKWALPQDELMKYPGFNPANREKDLAEAKRLLQQAGYPNGFKTKITYDPSATSGKLTTEIAANQLREIGVQAELDPLDRGVWGKREADGDYDIAQTGLGGGEEIPYKTYFERFHTKGPYSSKTGLGDPELDRLIDRLAAFQTDEERADAQRQAQRHILDKAYAVPLIDVLIYSWWQPWVHGYINERGNQIKPRLLPATIWLDVDALPQERRNEKP